MRKGGIVPRQSKFYCHSAVKSKYATQSTRTWALLTPRVLVEHTAVNNIMENNAEDMGKIVNAKSLEELAVAIRELAATSTLPVALGKPPGGLVWCNGGTVYPAWRCR
jgi:hypothetical protein